MQPHAPVVVFVAATVVAAMVTDGIVRSIAVALARRSFAGGVALQAPAAQAMPPVQAWPQVPQFAALVCVSTQAPLHVVWPVGQAQVPPAQVCDAAHVSTIEDVGGGFGKGYLAGFGMTIGTVFGRIAGQEAARRARN